MGPKCQLGKQEEEVRFLEKADPETLVYILGTQVREADLKKEGLDVCSQVIPSSLALPSFIT